jgi:lysophospholipase L1-like esterase
LAIVGTVVAVGVGVAWAALGRRVVPLYLGPVAFSLHAAFASLITGALLTLVAVGSSAQRLSALGGIVGLGLVVGCVEWFVRSARTTAGAPRGGATPIAGTDRTYQADLAAFERGGSRYRNTRRTRETFRSTTINIVDGWRTVPEPLELERSDMTRVMMFGGSTLVGIEVRDADTLPAALQRDLIRRGRRVAVHNFGVMGATAHGSCHVLRRTEMRPGDIVIVYFGANDVNVAALYGGVGRGPLRVIPGLVGALRIVGDLGRLHSVRLLARVVSSRSPVRRAAEATRRADGLVRTLDRAVRRVRRAGATPLLVLQPHRYSSADEELGVTAVRPGAPEGLAVTARRQYERIRERCRGIAEFHDLSLVLATEQAADAYVDWMHLTAWGNARVATELGAVVDATIG